MNRSRHCCSALIAVCLGMLISALLTPPDLLAYGCGEPQPVGKAKDVPNERWKYGYEGAGSYDIVHVGDGAVTVSVNTPGCATSQLDIVSIDLETGEERWRLDTIDASLISSGPAMSTGLLVLTVEEQFVALDPNSGQIVWIHNPIDPSHQLDDFTRFWIVSLDEGQLIYQSERDLVALDAATGRTIWRMPSPIEWGRLESASEEMLIGMGSVSSNEPTIALVGIDKLSGAEIWRIAIGEAGDESPGSTFWSLQMTNDQMSIACICSDDRSVISAVDNTSGRLLWQFDHGGTVTGFHDQPLHIVGMAPQMIVIPTLRESGEPELIALNAQTGEEHWRSRALDFWSRAAGELGVVGTLTDQTNSAHLGLLDPSTGELIWSQPFAGVEEGDLRSVFAFYGESIYVAWSQSSGEAAVMGFDLGASEASWMAEYPEFEAVFVDAATANTILVTGVSPTEAVLIALDPTWGPDIRDDQH